MRKIQINIELNMFDKDKPETVKVYADGQNLWEVICAGFDELMTAVKEKGRTLISFGTKEHYNK